MKSKENFYQSILSGTHVFINRMLSFRLPGYRLCFCLLTAPVFCFLSRTYAQSQTSCHCAGMAPAGKGTVYVAAGYNLDRLEEVEGDKRDKNIKSFLETVGNIKKLGKQADKTLDTMIKAEENWFINSLMKMFK